MGKSGSGKTSMRSIIFTNQMARDTRRLGATIDVEHSHVRFLDNLVLNLWDCGGQDAFMENYFTSQRDHIFRNVEVLIYVFDIESREVENDIHYYQSCLEAILQNSQDAKIFCLVHKMDLVDDDMRDKIFRERDRHLKEISKPLHITTFQTSIWDETLYQSWSSIVHALIPNVHLLEDKLESFCSQCGADEAILFERATCLVISSTSRKSFADPNRFSKISSIIKQFRFSCSEIQATFSSTEVHATSFSAYVDILTPSTFIMVVVSQPMCQPAALRLNIALARESFQRLQEQDADLQEISE